MENVVLKRATLEDLNDIIVIEQGGNSKTYFARTSEPEWKFGINLKLMNL